MSVLETTYEVNATPDQVFDLITDLSRISESTQVRKVTPNSAARMAAGATWKNRGATLKLPA
ncbi:MAG TPA: hypothetical protein VH951_06445, partial [Dehalococcoidia bacterium]